MASYCSQGPTVLCGAGVAQGKPMLIDLSVEYYSYGMEIPHPQTPNLKYHFIQNLSAKIYKYSRKLHFINKILKFVLNE